MKRVARLTLIAVVISTAAQAQSRIVALTFDDLPGADTGDVTVLAQTNAAVLQALDRHKAKAIGFVIGERVEARLKPVLQAWIDRGHDLGNHTYTHRDLNNQSADVFADEVARTEAVFRPLLPSPRTAPLYLRFPFNHTGDTADKRSAVAAQLAQRGYEVAVCTIDNSDYVFADAYARALTTGGSSAAIIRAEYLAHTAKVIDYYIGLHRTVFGRETAHVMLLHVNRLNADVLDQLLAMFEERQFRFVSLAEAQADPAYKTPDTWITKAGPMWGYRWARSLGVRVNGALEPEPAAWVTSSR